MQGGDTVQEFLEGSRSQTIQQALRTRRCRPIVEECGWEECDLIDTSSFSLQNHHETVWRHQTDLEAHWYLIGALLLQQHKSRKRKRSFTTQDKCWPHLSAAPEANLWGLQRRPFTSACGQIAKAALPACKIICCTSCLFVFLLLCGRVPLKNDSFQIHVGNLSLSWLVCGCAFSCVSLCVPLH